MSGTIYAIILGFSMPNPFGDESFNISGALHMIFGLILLWYSLMAAVLYYITDRILRKRNKEIKWYDALISLSIPFLTWIGTMGTVWIKEL
ncbi:hypothetical protein [Fictibacillus sp. 23RED33]|uniref:hypothetical protein n=1 Tax=Fictibacillus sp. 23RED33 TaxID=2745879 RepID=UPI001E31D9C9|nr:hypothetical protein [Fictibacillus sp. 23RED33]